ncbi:hypothetical protein MtrunA17_Chr1g0169251 [Medicago truncatula]|uniref:Uncharacterized protein n=1 Tax=Medicago truncatula TaxID=3880 RepID=A0A396JKE2_MEDTR|nr:hypothetical protein MtrunA17_Chr1g0169251 [Medicago truncatula]
MLLMHFIVKGSCGQSSSTSHSYDSGLLSCKSVYASKSAPTRDTERNKIITQINLRILVIFFLLCM